MIKIFLKASLHMDSQGNCFITVAMVEIRAVLCTVYLDRSWLQPCHLLMFTQNIATSCSQSVSHSNHSIIHEKLWCSFYYSSFIQYEHSRRPQSYAGLHIIIILNAGGRTIDKMGAVLKWRRQSRTSWSNKLRKRERAYEEASCKQKLLIRRKSIINTLAPTVTCCVYRTDHLSVHPAIPYYNELNLKVRTSNYRLSFSYLHMYVKLTYP